MNKQDIKEATPPLEERVAKIERTLETIAAQNQTVTPQKLDPKLEADQDAHQAAETSFQTERLGKQNVSRNSHPDAKEIDDE